MSNADIRGRFIWHELVTTDTDAAASFYSKVVGWKTQDSGLPGYTVWMTGKTQVGGLTALPADAAPEASPHWVVYIATPDVDATVATAERLGGKVNKPATDIPNMGRFAVLTDPQGAAFAVYTPPGPAPEGSGAAGPSDFGWHELATTDYAAAMSFYSELFGWEKGPEHDMGQMGVYQLVVHHGQQIGGIYNAHGPGTAPGWLTYIRVPDCAKATNVAKAAGARVLNGPMQVPGGSWITQLLDPQDGSFAVMEEPKQQAQKPPAKKPPAAKAAPPAAEPAAESVPVAAKEAPRKAPKKAVAAAKAKAAPPKKGAAKPAVAKKAVKKAARKTAKQAARKVARKVAKKAAKKASKKAAKKSVSAKRGKPAARKGAGKKAKRR